MELKFNIQTKIQKPIAEVFDAVYNPSKLSGYFTNGGASAPLDEGTTVEWAFADNPDEPKIEFPVSVKEVIKNELIVLGWEGSPGLETRIEMRFTAAGNETIVAISESGWKETPDDLNRSYMNSHGLVPDGFRPQSLHRIRHQPQKRRVHRTLRIVGSQLAFRTDRPILIKFL
ncbi:MAG: SRPBCC domain-containing protein [Pyrinomonadaceae bacterium]